MLSPEHVRRLAVPTVLLAAVGVAGLVAPGTWPFEMTFGVVQALLALSVGMLFGRAGLLMLCPFAFAAISVWVVLWINVNIDTRMPFPILVLLGALSAVPAGLLVGGLALRLRDVNLAVVTLAFAAAITAVFSRHSFPGTLDVVRVPVRPSTFKSDSCYYLLGFLILVATGLALEWLGRRPFGQAWRAVRSSERATAAAGLSVPRVKLSAFVTSAFIAGIAGAIYAGQLEGSVDIRSFSPLLSLAVVAAAIMFGAQSLSGAIVAGFLGSDHPGHLPAQRLGRRVPADPVRDRRRPRPVPGRRRDLLHLPLAPPGPVRPGGAGAAAGRMSPPARAVLPCSTSTA